MGRPYKPGERYIRTTKGIQYLMEKVEGRSNITIMRLTPYTDPAKTNKRSRVVHNPKEGIPVPENAMNYQPQAPTPTKAKKARYEPENKPPGENTLKGLRGKQNIHIEEHNREVAQVIRADRGLIKTWIIKHK